MDDAVDGLATIATGGIVAQAVEHASGSRHGAHGGAGGACLNCATVRVGEFCHVCGQGSHTHRTVAALGHDIAHGVFHFEGKIWKTLPMLIARPGALTRRYVHGERAKFVSPMALFLFSVFLLFAAVNRVAMPDVAGAAQGMARAQVEIGKDIARSKRELAELQAKRAVLLTAKTDTTAVDRAIAEAKSSITAMGIAAVNLPTGKGAKASREAENAASGNFTANTGIAAIDAQIEHVRENPALYFYKLKMASYKFSWALIPISVPFIWLLFCLRRDVGFYDHAIFAIYSLSFMTLLVVALIGLYLLGVSSGLLWIVFFLVPPIHMYKQLKGAYLLGRWGAWWRTWTLLIMTSITSSLFFALLLWLEAE